MIFESNAASPLSPAGFSSRLGERCLFVSVLPATVQPNPSWAPLLLDLCLLLYFGMASRKIGRVTEDRISRISKWIFLLNDAKCCVKLDNLFILLCVSVVWNILVWFRIFVIVEFCLRFFTMNEKFCPIVERLNTNLNRIPSTIFHMSGNRRRSICR